MMRKLSFWKKSKSSSSIKPFNVQGDESDAGEELVRLPEADSSPASVQDLPSLKGAPATAPRTPSPRAAAAGDLPAGDLQASSPTAAKPRQGSPCPPQAEHPSESSPVPPASEREDALVFGLPPEAVHGKIGEAFGQMVAQSLQSSKWDKRSQALKAVSTVLKGLEVQGKAPPGSTGAIGKGLRLHDREGCWRASCLLLNVALRDKVIPIRLAALELFLDAFAAATVAAVPQEDVRHALDVLVEHLVDRLGDSNLRLHESARKCLLFTAESSSLLGLGPALAKLKCRLGKAGKGGERTKVHFGILDTVNFLLQHFPGSRGNCHIDEDLDDDEEVDAHRASEDSWTQHDIAPFIVAGMEDSLGPRVRESAAALAVTVYQTFGTEAMKPILAELRPAKQALLRQKFEEFEGFEPEGEDEEEGPELRPADLDGLVVCGSAIQRPRSVAAPRAAAQLPGCVDAEYDEEFIMDGILEETGMVFNGTGMISEAAASRRLPPGFIEEHLGLVGLDLDEDDHRFLEEELAYLAMGDSEAADEQEALLLSLQEQPGLGQRGVSVEVF